MLTKLRIQNFKSWKDTEPIRLAPITVFFGVNSAGKTSLLQFLLMLKQTSESSDRRRVLHPGDDYTPVELGTFQDLIFEHDANNPLEFEVSWTLPTPLQFIDPLKKKRRYQGDAMEFSAQIASTEDTQHVEWLEYNLLDHRSSAASVRLARTGPRPQEYKLTAQAYELIKIQGRAWPVPPPARFYSGRNWLAMLSMRALFVTTSTFLPTSSG